MTTLTTYTHHHRLIPPGVHLRPSPGRRVVVRRPSGRAPGWETVLQLQASEHPTSLRDVEVDGRWIQEGWPHWSTVGGIEHSPNVAVAGELLPYDRQPGLVEITDVTSIDAAGDGLQVLSRATVGVRGGRFTGARAGIAVTAAGCDVEVRGCSVSSIDVEPDGIVDMPHVSRLAFEDVVIEAGGFFDAALKSVDAKLIARRVGPSTRTTIVDNATPGGATPGQLRHHFIDCALGDIEIVSPRSVLLEGCALGAVVLSWQNQYRPWAPGTLKLDGCTLGGAWTTVGYGRLEIVGCAGPLDLTVSTFAGYDPATHPIVVVRDGVQTTIRQLGRYAL